MTLHGKGRDKIPDRKFIFPAIKKLSDSEMRYLKQAERQVENFINLDKVGSLSTGMHVEIFHVYNGLNAFNICEDKSINRRIKEAISKLEKLMRKYNIRGTY